MEWPFVVYANRSVRISRIPYVAAEGIRTLDVRPTLCVGDGASLNLAVLQGAGVGYVSRFSVKEALDDGRLVEVLPHVSFPDYDPVYVARADLRLVSARVQAFELALAEVVEERAGST